MEEQDGVEDWKIGIAIAMDLKAGQGGISMAIALDWTGMTWTGDHLERRADDPASPSKCLSLLPRPTSSSRLVHMSFERRNNR